jgi:hypothetical protein
MKFCNIKKNPHYRFAALSSRCFLCLCKYSYIMVSVCQSEVICSILQTCFFTSCVLFKLIISHSWVIYNMWIYLDQWVVRLFLVLFLVQWLAFHCAIFGTVFCKSMCEGRFQDVKLQDQRCAYLFSALQLWSLFFIVVSLIVFMSLYKFCDFLKKF